MSAYVEVALEARNGALEAEFLLFCDGKGSRSLVEDSLKSPGVTESEVQVLTFHEP